MTNIFLILYIFYFLFQVHKIAEAEARLVKLRKDEAVRAEIDALLLPAIESKCLDQLEIALSKATTGSVTSKTIESARLLSGQLRFHGDKGRILLLLKDSLRLRSVAVLEHVVKSAVEAGERKINSYIMKTFFLNVEN